MTVSEITGRKGYKNLQQTIELSPAAMEEFVAHLVEQDKTHQWRERSQALVPRDPASERSGIILK